jgi:hypothetical protein
MMKLWSLHLTIFLLVLQLSSSQENKLFLTLNVNGINAEYDIPRDGSKLYSTAEKILHNHPQILHMQGPIKINNNTSTSDHRQTVVSSICMTMTKIIMKDINEVFNKAISREFPIKRDLHDAIDYAVVSSTYHSIIMHCALVQQTRSKWLLASLIIFNSVYSIF